MIDKKIQVCVGTDRSKRVRARVSLMLIETSRPDEPMVEHFHSIMIEPGADLAAIRRALETQFAMAFEQNGIPLSPWPKIPDQEWTEVEDVCAVLHKPDVVAAFKAKKKG